MPKPSSLDPEVLRLWSAWYLISGYTKEQAMLEYCRRVLQLYTGALELVCAMA